MKYSFAIMMIVLPLTGCTTKSGSRAAAQAAFLAGQNEMLQQQLAARTRSVTVLGEVQNSEVAWVEGLTLAQAVATAKYVGRVDPKHIIITHQGESATLEAKILFSGVDIPLDAGDVVELRP